MNNDYIFTQLSALEDEIKRIQQYIVDGIQDDHTKPVSFLYNYNQKIQKMLVRIGRLKRVCDTHYYTDEEIEELGLCTKDFYCGGGELVEIGTVSTGYCDVPNYRCTHCGDEFDATDYEKFACYWATKDELHHKLPLVFNTEETITMTFKPLHDRVLVKRTEEKEVTKGGIIIPEMGKEKPSEGTVYAVGTGKVLPDGTVHPMNVNVQDVILFGKYVGTDITINDEQYIILKEDDILGILENTNEL